LYYQHSFGRFQSQRDCATKPRVARNELPWVRHGRIVNPNGVVPLAKAQAGETLSGFVNGIFGLSFVLGVTGVDLRTPAIIALPSN
jgi:hypothetical protein